MDEFTKVYTDGTKEVYKRTRTKLPAIRRSLALLVLSLQGSEVIIELKNDTEISGLVEDVDPAMSVVLTSATQTLLDGSKIEMESITIKGTSIRYVHIPPKVKMRPQVSDFLKRVDRIKTQSKPHAIKDRPKANRPDATERADIVLN